MKYNTPTIYRNFNPPNSLQRLAPNINKFSASGNERPKFLVSDDCVAMFSDLLENHQKKNSKKYMSLFTECVRHSTTLHHARARITSPYNWWDMPKNSQKVQSSRMPLAMWNNADGPKRGSWRCLHIWHRIWEDAHLLDAIVISWRWHPSSYHSSQHPWGLKLPAAEEGRDQCSGNNRANCNNRKLSGKWL